MERKNRNCIYTGEMKRRSWVKSLTWRIIGVAILVAISWLFTRDWEQASLITLTFHGLRLVLYYYHERYWDNIDWGRIKVKQEHDYGEGI